MAGRIDEIEEVLGGRTAIDAAYGEGHTLTGGGGGGGSALIIPTPLVTLGHSIPAGDDLLNAADRFPVKLAKLLATTDAATSGLEVSGTGLLSDNGGTTFGHLATGGGNWPTLMQSLAPHRSRAPYLSPIHIGILASGINDIAQYGPVNTAFKESWKQTLFAMACRLRCGHVIEDSDGLCTYAGSWLSSLTGLTGINSGTSVALTTTNGASVSLAVPADYDGQAIVFFFLGAANDKNWATWTITHGGTTLAAGSNQGQCQGINLAPALPFAVRVPTPDPTTFRGQTLVATVSGIGGAFATAFFDCIGFESSPAPAVVLADTLRPNAAAGGSYAAAYSGWPHTPTDADVLALNAENAVVAGLFADGRVVCDGADATINATGNWVGDVHPDERLTGRIAAIQQAAIAAVLPAADVPVLGMV